MPITHHYAPTTQNATSATPIRLQEMGPDDSASLDKMIKLAKKLATHPSILNAFSIVLRYKWSDEKAKDVIPLDAKASEKEVAQARKFLAGAWPGIYADESNTEHGGWQSRKVSLPHKIFVSLEVGFLFLKEKFI